MANKIVINEELLALIVPGMLKSADDLFVLNESAKDDPDLAFLSFGSTVSMTIISGQCAELLLKYKIQQEGKVIEPIHDLHKLFTTLKEESKNEIKDEFGKLKQQLSTSFPDGWDNVESIFQKARHAFVYWRYAVETGQQSGRNESGCNAIFPYPLYIAAFSVYRTTPIVNWTFTKKVVNDPVRKAKLFGITEDK